MIHSLHTGNLIFNRDERESERENALFNMSIFVYIEGVLFVQNGKEEQPAVKSGLRLDKLDAQNQ